jgi:hypothetical protein
MDFLQDVQKHTNWRTFAAIASAGAADHAELYALLVQFPSIARDPEVSLAEASEFAATRLSTAAMASLVEQSTEVAQFATGALPPAQSWVSDGFQLPASGEPPVQVVHQPDAVGHCPPTPVRDQGQRGTCVAHAVVACAERHWGALDLSEQLLFWAAKLHGGDPYPQQDGTFLRCAERALQGTGVCAEAHWLYNGGVQPGDVTHSASGGVPTVAALADAATRRHAGSQYADVSALHGGKASGLIQEVAAGPVAISVPVFYDPLSRVSNWSWLNAVRYGHVLDPTHFSVVSGGHAVCVCGFVPDAGAPGGGWFVFKNSWSTNWNSGAAPPPPGHPSVAMGYGYLSAAYVDRFLWERLRL